MKYKQIKAALVFIISLFASTKGIAQLITTIAGNGKAGYNDNDHSALNSRIEGLTGACIDPKGNIYFSEYISNKIKKIGTDGSLSIVAGIDESGFKGDGGLAVNAKISGPTGLALDEAGNLLFSDSHNNRIRKIAFDNGGVITTIAGMGSSGYDGNGKPATAAQIQNPGGIAVDKSGNIYFADCDNNCIRKIDKKGIISVFAGNATGAGSGIGGFSGDGGLAINAAFNHPKGICIDATGEVYVSDCFNQRIRKISKQGIITTIAGTGTQGFNGDNIKANKANLNYPDGLAVDNSGNVFFSDHNNNRVRMISNKGIITTIAGTGIPGFTSDGGLAALAEINEPTFIITDKNGEIYFGDNGNKRIRHTSYTEENSMTNTHLSGAKPINNDNHQVDFTHN